MHELREVHPLNTGGAMTEAMLHKLGSQAGFILDFFRRSKPVEIAAAVQNTSHVIFHCKNRATLIHGS